jgi:hypothetical protein
MHTDAHDVGREERRAHLSDDAPPSYTNYAA